MKSDHVLLCSNILVGHVCKVSWVGTDDDVWLPVCAVWNMDTCRGEKGAAGYFHHHSLAFEHVLCQLYICVCVSFNIIAEGFAEVKHIMYRAVIITLSTLLCAALKSQNIQCKDRCFFTGHCSLSTPYHKLLILTGYLAMSLPYW